MIPLQSIQAEFAGDLPPHEGVEAIRLGMHIILSNLLAFVPLGIFLPMLFQKGRRWYVVLSVSLGAAVLVEVIQYFIGRTADIDDVLLRVAGCMPACAAYCAIQSVWKRKPADG